METGLPSALSLRQIKTEQNAQFCQSDELMNMQPLLCARSLQLETQNVPPENGCILSLQAVSLLSESSCPVRIKQESDLHESESLPCPQFEEIKEESIEINGFIKKEQLDDPNLTQTSEVTLQCEDLPQGLIPPIEMEEEECDIACPQNSSACLFEPLNKKGNASKVKLKALNTGKKCKSKRRKAQQLKNHYCDEARDGRTLLKMHTHTDSGEAFWCETCGKEFKRSDLLTNHRKVHNRKRPYPCDQCGMTFAKPAYLKIHLRRHAGERAFPCDQCDKRFFDKYDLEVHQRDHTGERPYVCRECGKSFKRIYILNKHKRTHSKDRPFQCNVCGKAYKYGYSYRLHMKDHSA